MQFSETSVNQIEGSGLTRLSGLFPRLALILFLLTAFAPVISAQTTLGLLGTDEDLRIFYDRLEADISTDGGGRSLVVLGNVLLEGRGFSLRADAVGVYVDGVDPENGPIRPRVLALG